MAPSHCPHCGASVLMRGDVFCSACQEPLDEPPPEPRTKEQQAAFREESNRNFWLAIAALVTVLVFARRVLRLCGFDV